MPVDHLQSKYGLENHGLTNLGRVHWNHNTPALYEAIIRKQEGHISHLGPVVVRTGTHTGRAAKDKFIVAEPTSESLVWWGNINKPYPEDKFKLLFRRIQAFLQGKEVYVQDCYAGADPDYRMPIRVITENAWHNLFARNMFIQAPVETLEDHVPEFTVLQVPNFHADPDLDGTHSDAFILLNLGMKMVLIGGTAYGGEIKKSIFTVMNYLLPQSKVLSMHCSANIGPEDDAALFFGLSGTGKTTLSADPNRNLVGDDEHGWSDNGIFNFEGGCYAKVIGISKEHEPEIYETTRRFGTILENVGFDSITRRLDLDDDSLTENTRAAYPIPHIPNALREKRCDHPKNLIMLTSDAFGVLPPIAKLTPEQAMYHFISGYTAKLAGTEIGITEPTTTFSACFGEPFMVLHPFKYAELLRDKINKHNVDCWLVNTGWTGGPYGVGKRMHLPHTRTLVNAALDGSLREVEYDEDPIFRVQVPRSAPGVPSEILNPRNTWEDKEAYDQKAIELAGKFKENFTNYESEVSQEVRDAGPTTEPLVVA
ncbi:phosphoenolpyruvate carboxykinase (ATP) [candidate division LCP-89 bacterium B3_LCP]|uniref:Phosphoenolpyruvate carboxykinase (ATP) n=1 Tax=candidate division LCP-89 bacterium B3_LCP TaxID=2012998 RepID=A0A532V1G5_UNCL8|nr:MAG: phosphoenolpyruvate carboxykinase (ATP) [candidate division LCP-89 bacterium B3_LCP]